MKINFEKVVKIVGIVGGALTGVAALGAAANDFGKMAKDSEKKKVEEPKEETN